MKNNFYVCFCTDNRPIKDIGVCLESLFANNPYKFEVFILHSKEIDTENLYKVAGKWDQKLSFIKVDSSKVKGLPLNDFWVEETYYRMLIPSYLPKYIDKVLYLDTDTLVVKDISELFKLDISKYSLAARPAHEHPSQIGRHEDFLGIKRGTYFGAGIVMLNLKKIRKEKSFGKAISFGKKNPQRIKAVDQDLLNIFFSNDYFRLDGVYHCALLDGYKSTCPPDKTRIVHFTGKYKGSSYLCLHPLRKKYLLYLQSTPWKNQYDKMTLKRKLLRTYLLMGRIIKNSSVGRLVMKITSRPI